MIFVSFFSVETMTGVMPAHDRDHGFLPPLHDRNQT
jgi:hypothetical protein